MDFILHFQAIFIVMIWVKGARPTKRHRPGAARRAPIHALRNHPERTRPNVQSRVAPAIKPAQRCP